MSHCCSAAMIILNQLGYEHYSNCSAHCTRMSTLPHIRLEFADENKESTVVWQYAAHLVPKTRTSVGNENQLHGAVPPYTCTHCRKSL